MAGEGRRVSVQVSAASLAGLGASATETGGTIAKIIEGNAQVTLDDGSKVWRVASDLVPADDPWGAAAGEDIATELPPSKSRAGRKLHKAGMRSSRRVSFLRRSNDAVQMGNIQQAECVTAKPPARLQARGRTLTHARRTHARQRLAFLAPRAGTSCANLPSTPT